LLKSACRVVLAVALLGAWLGEPVSAQQGIVRPRRLVHLFDFEEPGNYESLPQNWFIIGRPAETSSSRFFREPLHHELMERPGYPSFTRVRFDTERTFSGGRSLYMGLNGGSAGAFLEVGAIPAVPHSDYLITAAVRTESLARSSAYLSAYFVDHQGNRIDASITETRPIKTLGEWTQVALKLRGDADGAVWIGLEADIRQPKRLKNDPLGAQRVLLKDVRGGAWFDDIGVWQLPRIEVASQSKVNIIRAPATPKLPVTVRDLTGQSLTVELTAYDHELRPAAFSRFELGPGAPRHWTWEPDLPGYGWYLVDMQVRDQTQGDAGSARVPVARTFGAFLWLPPTQTLHAMDASRFEIIAQGLPPEEFKLLPELLEGTGIRSTVLSVWDPETHLGNIEERNDQIDQMMQWLYLSGRSAALSLDPIPKALAMAMNSPAADPVTVLGSERSQWIAYLTPTLLSHGQRVSRWFLGSPDEAYAFYDPDLPAVTENVLRQFTALAPTPELVMPWRIDQSRRYDVSDELHYLLTVPPGVPADQIPAYLEQWRDIRDKLTLCLREPPADQMSHARRVTDLAIRMLTAWEQQPGVIAVSGLWTTAAQRQTAIVPDPLLGVFSNFSNQLAGRRVVGRLNLGGGLSVRILDGPSGPALAAWAQQPGAEASTLNLFMGPNPVAIDVWGNRTAIPLSDGKHRYDVPETPIFITGIDPKLALFRAGFMMDKPFIESTQTQHERVLTLTNPWPMTISGYMKITGPGNWSSKPTRHFFSIAAGRSVTLPVELSFPVSEVAGPKQLTARFEFTAEESMLIDLALPLEVGLEDVTFNATVALVPGEEAGTEDATAAAVVTNTGTEKLTLYIFANLRGHPIQERIISELDPGQTAIRHFKFPGAGQALRDSAMRIGLREVDGPRMLNQRLSVEDLE
jgi:hypothetical protein